MATKIKKREKTKKNETIIKEASLPKRFLSYIIDWYIGALAAAFPISIIAEKIYGTMLRQDIIYFEEPFGLIGGILAIFFASLYYVYIPSTKSYKGQTLGKRICKIKIVKEDNSDVDLKTMLIRQLLGIIVIEGSMYTVSSIWHQLVLITTGIEIITPLKYIGIALVGISSLLILFHSDHKAIHDYLAKTKVISTK